jgi:hypothetical protein
MTEGMTCRPLERRVCGEKSFGISRLVLGVGLLLMAACTGRSDAMKSGSLPAL